MKVADSHRESKQGEVARLTVGGECCLEGAAESALVAIRSILTIDNPKYQAAKKYSRWVGKKLKPKLYFFREEKGRIIFPRGFGNQAVLLCRQQGGQTVEIEDRRRRLPEQSFLFHGELRPYQEEAVAAVLRHSFGVLEAGTGSGKTVMALNIIAARQQPTIIIVHSKELLHQWRDRIQQFLGVEAGQAGDGIVAVQPITVAIVNTARKHIDSLSSQFGHLVVDECHRVPASLFTDVVSAFDSFYMLGLSATAYRREDNMTRLIYTYMGDRVHAVDGRALAESGAVVRPQLVQRETAFSYAFRGEYSALIKALAADEQRNNQIVSDISKLLSSGQQGTLLLVSDRVAHCELFSRKLALQGLDSVVLTGQVSTSQRSRIVEQIREGQVKILISTIQLIGEGFDCPDLTTLVLATPIKFEGRLVQVVGRIMRPAAEKKAVVVDYVDVQVPLLHRAAMARSDIFDRW